MSKRPRRPSAGSGRKPRQPRKPDPYLWAQEARGLYARAGEPGRIARERVGVEYEGGSGTAETAGRRDRASAIVLTLWTNPDYADPDELDYERGVALYSVDHQRGERAIALAALIELVSIETLRTWTLREVAKREAEARQQRTTGKRLLARDLLATGVPAPKPLKAPLKAMYRAVERWSTTAREQHITVSGANRRRVEALRGDVLTHARAMLAQNRPEPVRSKQDVYTLVPVRPLLSVWGWWRFSEDEHPARVHSAPQDEEAARDVIANMGHGHTALVEAAADTPEGMRRPDWESAPELLWVNGLGIELNL